MVSVLDGHCVPVVFALYSSDCGILCSESFPYESVRAAGGGRRYSCRESLPYYCRGSVILFFIHVSCCVGANWGWDVFAVIREVRQHAALDSMVRVPEVDSIRC